MPDCPAPGGLRPPDAAPGAKPTLDSSLSARQIRSESTLAPADSTTPAPVANSWADTHPVAPKADGNAAPVSVFCPPPGRPHEPSAVRSNPRNSAHAPDNAAPRLVRAKGQSTSPAVFRRAPPIALPRAPRALA